jgi:hypothetical protein
MILKTCSGSREYLWINGAHAGTEELSELSKMLRTRLREGTVWSQWDPSEVLELANRQSPRNQNRWSVLTESKRDGDARCARGL